MHQCCGSTGRGKKLEEMLCILGKKHLRFWGKQRTRWDIEYLLSFMPVFLTFFKKENALMWLSFIQLTGFNTILLNLSKK